jgi:ABC-type proline/glycine betaine transport system permease subunit
MGYGGARLLWRIELPLALPVIMTGVRIATVSTVALATIGVINGNGGLGQVILRGFQSDYKAQVLTGTLLCLLLALVADLALGAPHQGAHAVDEEAGMSAVSDAVVWLNDPLNWKGPQGIPALALEQLGITAVAVGVGALVALPLAFVLGHYGRGGGFVVATSNVSRAVPTFALLVVFASTAIGFGNRATTVALIFFAIPPVLANAYTGIRGVDRRWSRPRAGWACPSCRCSRGSRLRWPCRSSPRGSVRPRSRSSRPRRWPRSWVAAPSARSSTTGSATRTTARSSRAAAGRRPRAARRGRVRAASAGAGARSPVDRGPYPPGRAGRRCRRSVTVVACLGPPVVLG